MIDEKTKDRILEALNDEYKARAFYRLVLKAFGPVKPFINIVEAEDAHARALEAVCVRHGIPLPADEWEATLPAPSSVLEACRAGVAGEIENIAMYDRLLRQTEEPDVRALFSRLQARSRDVHLPAFERCVARHEQARGGPRPGTRWPSAGGAGIGPRRVRRRGKHA